MLHPKDLYAHIAHRFTCIVEECLFPTNPGAQSCNTDPCNHPYSASDHIPTPSPRFVLSSYVPSKTLSSANHPHSFTKKHNIDYSPHPSHHSSQSPAPAPPDDPSSPSHSDFLDPSRSPRSNLSRLPLRVVAGPILTPMNGCLILDLDL